MLAGAFSCRHLNAHRSDEYIVPEASDGDVIDTSCPGGCTAGGTAGFIVSLIRDRNRHTSDFHVAPSSFAEGVQRSGQSLSSLFGASTPLCQYPLRHFPRIV